MSVTIYKYGTLATARATIDADDTSQQSVTLMNEDNITLNFTVPTPIQFQIGDFCFFIDRMYQINALPKTTLNSSRNITYNLVMESEMYDLGKVAFLFLDANNNFTKSIFTFRGTPQDYMNLLIYNLLRVYPIAPWTLGSIVEADFITQDFSGQNCLQALKTIASIFQTEYIIESKVINLYQRQSSSGVVMKCGINEALLSIVRDNQTNANIITRLYAFGSTRNITPTYRNGSANLRMGELNYLEKNIDLYKIWESSIIFDGTTTDVKTNSPLPEIYPHRTGTVTAVDPTSESNYFLNFFDTTIDFNVNDNLIAGVTAQVVFNTGLLAGYTFQIGSFFEPTSKFTINQDTSNANLIAPSALLYPQVGDEYVIINISLPQVYIDNAEAALRNAAQAYLDENSVPPESYTVKCNPNYFRTHNLSLVLGQSIGIESDVLLLNRSSRITSYTRNIRNPNLFSVTLADTVAPNSILVKIINAI